MAAIIHQTGILPHEQVTNEVNHVPSQRRINYTPGKATAGVLDQNWGVHFECPVGIPVVDAWIRTHNQKQTVVQATRTGAMDNILLPTLAQTNVTETRIDSARDADGTVVVALKGSHTLKKTATVPNNGKQEKTVGGFGYTVIVP